VRESVLIVRERAEDGSCDDGHLHQVHMALGRFELVQLRHASLGDVERSTFVVLAAVEPTRRPGTGPDTVRTSVMPAAVSVSGMPTRRTPGSTGPPK